MPNDDLLYFFDTRAQAIALAAQQVSAKTLATANAKKAGASLGTSKDTSSHKITLELTTVTPLVNSNNNPNAAGTVNLTTGLQNVAAIQARQPAGWTLTFDVAPPSDGYAQQIDIVANSRQSVHTTAVGFYVDEFNLGVGQLSVAVDVLYSMMPAQQIQTFFDMLNRAKISNPLSAEGPYRLRYFDTFLDRSLEITQDSVRLQIDAERPNRARLMIAATVLYDYSSQAIRNAAAAAVSAGATTSLTQAGVANMALTSPSGGTS